MINWRPEGDAHDARSLDRMQPAALPGQCVNTSLSPPSAFSASIHLSSALQPWQPLSTWWPRTLTGLAAGTQTAPTATWSSHRQRRTSTKQRMHGHKLNAPCRSSMAVASCWAPVAAHTACACSVAPLARSVLACPLQRRRPRSAVCCCALHFNWAVTACSHLARRQRDGGGSHGVRAFDSEGLG